MEDRSVTSAPRLWLRGRRLVSISYPAVFVLAALVVIALVPFVTDSYVQSLVLTLLMYVALALSWNLIGGFAGYFSFGHVGYFGLGAYVGALSIVDLDCPWYAAALIAMLVTGAFATVIGFASLRIKGPAFAIVTLAASQALRILVYIFAGWTGGGSGLSLPPIPSLVPIYASFAVAAALALVATWQIARSQFGLHLKAIRDDELAAEAIGIDTAREKLKAFVLSTFLPGFCGAVYASYLSYVHPEEVFSLRINVSMIVMALLGGAGTVFGPVVGALLVFGVSELLWARFPVLHQLAFGVALMALVLFLPGGLMGQLKRAPAGG
jgi:branched-chain amino acid transport system permease protein